MEATTQTPVLLVCGESTDSALFARMLYLSLGERGYAVKTLSPSAPVNTSPTDAIALLDADVLSDEARAAWAQSRRCIFYTADATLASLQDEQAVWLVRPFAVHALLSLLAESGAPSVLPLPMTAKEEGQQAAPRLPSEELSFSGEEVSFRGVNLSLTARERELLRYLYERRGQVCSRAQILEQVWHYPPSDTKTNVADVYVRYLRAKIDQVFDVRLICAVRRGGYTMR